MSINKSVQYTFLSILAAGQLLVPMTNVVYASENGQELALNSKVDITERDIHLHQGQIDAIRNILNNENEDLHYIVDSYINYFREEFPSIEESINIHEELLFSLSLTYILSNNIDIEQSDNLSAFYTETYELIEILNSDEFSGRFLKTQTYEEQIEIIQEYLQIIDFESLYYELSDYYSNYIYSISEYDAEDLSEKNSQNNDAFVEKNTEEEINLTPDTTEVEVDFPDENEKVDNELENNLDEQESEQETPVQKVQIQSFSTMRTTTNAPATKLHKVKNGDTLWSISVKYNVSVSDLQAWNQLGNSTFLKVGQYVGVNGTFNDGSILYSSRERFIETILPAAKMIAEKYNLYTSVLIAQAVQESSGGNSALAKISNNIFGIKAMSNNYVEKMTLEQKADGTVYEVFAKFEAYANHHDAIVSYADKIRNGVSWDPLRYKGAWPENTKSYMDATAALTGTYATHITYNVSLNNIIKQYNLTQYDTHIGNLELNPLNTVISTTNTDYSAKVTSGDHSIDTLPWGVPGYRTLARSNKYQGQTFRVTQEKVTGRATWAYLSGLGWIDKKGITPEAITSSKNVSYKATIARTWDSITTLPWGVPGYKTVAKSSDFIGQTVEVTKEAVTPRATWAYIVLNGRELGWIDASGLRQDINTVLSTTNTDYSAKVTSGDHSIDTLPWGVPGYRTLARSNKYQGQTFRVTQEKVTGRATWAYLSGLGWIDKKGITPEAITSSKNVSYKATIARTWDSITTLPWGVPGYKTVAKSSDFIGQTVEVTKEAVTPRATWAYIVLNGRELGWIDASGLRQDINTVLSTTNTDYSAKVTSGDHSIDTLPWGVPGYRTLARSNKYQGQTFRVTQEKVTGRATWAYLSGLGWIDKKGITPEAITSSKNVSYKATIARTWDSITTLPWGVPGYKTVAKSSDFIGQTVEVTKEAVTPRATWAYIVLNGRELGWIDASGLRQDINTVLSTTNTDYSAKVTSGDHSIDTLPWGVPGYRTLARSNKYQGQTFRVTQEKVTGRATWAYLSGLGWIDKKGITPEAITSSKNVSYKATIARTWDSITTLPWGVPGYKTVAKSSDFIGQTVEVTKEAVTPRATWAYIVLNGRELGWIDASGLRQDINTVLSTTNTDYSAKVTSGDHSIDTLPWGVPGYRTLARSNKYQGQTFRVTQEKVTGRATWAYLSGLGWIDKKGITPEAITSSKNVSYKATIARTWDSITTLPWGVPGYKTVAKSSDFIGQTVEVTKEAVTPRATWAYIVLNGRELGWIDASGLRQDINTVLSTTNTDYSAKVTSGDHSIDTLPWGVPGYRTLARSNKYQGQTFRVTQEKVTGRATWAYLSGLGWIDKKGITPEAITSSKNVSYKATIARTWDSITTLPWGVPGYKTVAKSSDFIGQTVEVTKEAVTPRATWAYIVLNGRELGWIDISGIQKEDNRNIIFIDAGHGGSDPGASYFGVNEKDINLSVSLKLQRELEKRGYVVIMSRTSDIAIDFKTERSNIANKTNADVFISVHHNANPNYPTANGIETFYYKYDPNYPSKINKDHHNDPLRILESAKLAKSIQDALVASTGLFDRGVKSDTFAVLRETRIPAILLELGFMSNKDELNKLVTSAHQDKEVLAIANGIDAYFKGK